MKTIRLCRLSNPQAEAVGSQIKNILDKIKFTEEEEKELKTFSIPFIEILEKFISARHQTDITYASNHKEALNNLRNLSRSALKFNAKAYLNSNIEAESRIAMDLLEIIKNHEKEIDGRAYDLLSVKINAITEEIEEKIPYKNLSLINATKWLEALKIAQNNFINYTVDLSVASAENSNSSTPCDLRDEYLTKLETLINLIPFLNIKTPSENYQKLILSIKEIIEKAFTATKAKAKAKLLK